MIKFHHIISRLKPGDRIVTPRSGWRLIHHHAIYWGIDSFGVHWIIENQESVGVRFITLEKFLQDVFEIKRIEYFRGNETQRNIALDRGEKLIGKSYDLFNFNCEHFSNFIQYGHSHSKQVENLKDGLKIVAGIGIFLITINAIAKSKL